MVACGGAVLGIRASALCQRGWALLWTRSVQLVEQEEAVDGAGRWGEWCRSVGRVVQWVQWMAQEGAVNGAGQRGKWSRSVLVVGTCTAKRPRMAIPGAGQ